MLNVHKEQIRVPYLLAAPSVSHMQATKNVIQLILFKVVVSHIFAKFPRTYSGLQPIRRLSGVDRVPPS